MTTRISAAAACLFSILILNGCEDDMATVVPRTMLHTTDLDAEDFAIRGGKVVVQGGLKGPFQITEGTIADYENQSGRPELVWLGGTEAEPACAWIVWPDGTAVKIKWPSPDGIGFCDAVVECAIADLDQGGGVAEKYLVPEMTGPTWQILSVVHGEGGDSVDFSADTAGDLVGLMGALNDSDNLPDGWLWSISGGVLALSVPYGTGVTLMQLPGGVEVEYDSPSVPGSPPSQLAAPMAQSLAGPMDLVIAQYEALLESYAGVLANAFGVGTATSAAGIEAEFVANAKIEVRWTDSDGDARISYKDPVNGWHHVPPESFVSVTPFVIYSNTGVSTTVDIEIDLQSMVWPPNFTPYAAQVLIRAGIGNSTSITESTVIDVFPMDQTSSNPASRVLVNGGGGLMNHYSSAIIALDQDGKLKVKYSGNDASCLASVAVTGFFVK